MFCISRLISMFLQVKTLKQKKRSAKFRKETKTLPYEKKVSWRDLAFKKRCQERIAQSHAIDAEESEERRKKEEEEKLQAVKQ